MDILDRLEYYRNQKSGPLQEETAAGKNIPLAEFLGGTHVADGVIKIESFFLLHLQHTYKIDEFNLKQIELPILTRGVFSPHIDLSKVILFDLETTGLAGGTGTYPFLQAYGLVENDQLKVVQYFLSDFGCEPAVFSDLKRLISKKDVMISYNGKSFDYPLLKNRFILNRVINPFENFRHLDLLHLARRAWRKQLDGFSMEFIEQKIFLFSRWRDIDGWLIPQAYFEFIRSGKPDDIVRIVRHNQQDIVSLLRLLIHLHVLENENSHVYNTPVELENLLRQAIKKGDLATVEILKNQCDRRSLVLEPGLKLELSLLFKRNRLWESALGLWNELSQSEHYFVFAFEEMAKYYEHQVGDYRQALSVTERALEVVRIMEELNTSSTGPQNEKNFLIRHARLCRKSGKKPLT